MECTTFFTTRIRPDGTLYSSPTTTSSSLIPNSPHVSLTRPNVEFSKGSRACRAASLAAARVAVIVGQAMRRVDPGTGPPSSSSRKLKAT